MGLNVSKARAMKFSRQRAWRLGKGMEIIIGRYWKKPRQNIAHAMIMCETFTSNEKLVEIRNLGKNTVMNCYDEHTCSPLTSSDRTDMPQ